MVQLGLSMMQLCGSLVLASLFLTPGCAVKVSFQPVGVNPAVDCSIRELAWEYSRKLLPQRGRFPEVYDALQLGPLCNVSLTSGRTFPTKPFLHQTSVNSYSVELYVDSTHGNDNNPGTLEKPLKSLGMALELYAFEASGKAGIIYLRSGTYFLSSTLTIGPKYSHLTISGYKDEKVIISGGRQYQFEWSEYFNAMGRLLNSTSCINETGILPGQSSRVLSYYGKVSGPEECQSSCLKDPSCFAFTYGDKHTGEFANMCYFRTDGLCPYTTQLGYTSGKYIHIVVTDLSNQNPNPFTSLFINSRRAVRARYPDGNPETMGLHTLPTGYVKNAEQWLPPVSHGPATEIRVASPQRNHTHFPQFQLGIGGPVSAFDPPESYWGTKNPTGGGGRTYTIPSGLQYSRNEIFANRTWTKPETGVVHTFHCSYWANWQFALSGRNSKKRYLTWNHGGFQEARGCKSGQEWYVENIFEELDSPNEWYLDDTAMKLYYFPNGSLPSQGVGTILDQLILLQGSQQDPIYNVTLRNITFAHSATTFLRSYEVPSAGDWAVHRGGALTVEGVHGFLLQNCLFDAPGGNAVVLSNYVRNAVIEGNEFAYTGDSAILAIGSTDLIDGTNGNQPRGTKIIGNVAREIGIYGKQVSPYMQSLACQTEISGNTFFNGGRAGINLNDGFGGGNLIKNNLLFNFVRETHDHGPINTWDRQPYLTKVRNGSVSLAPAVSNTTQNFIIANYYSLYPIDHDDGSAYYYDSKNFNIYGGFKDYLGHTVTAEDNIYIYPDAAFNTSGFPAILTNRPFCAVVSDSSRGSLPSGWGLTWSSNKCVIGMSGIYSYSKCDPTNPKNLVPFTANNSFYAPGKYVFVDCGNTKLKLSQYQDLGYDIGSTVHNLPTVDQIIEWGREVLGI